MSQTKTHIELEVTVYYDFHPHEPQTRIDPEVRACIENMFVILQNSKEDGVRDITNQLTDLQRMEIRDYCMECEVKDPDHL